jgi:hypothetical protein
MGQIVKGPFDLQYGLNTLAEIENIDFSYDVDSDDKKTVQGHSKTIYGAHKVSVKAKFLETDIPSLAVVLPQYHVAMGDTLSSGETVTDADGAIDLVPGGCAAGSTTADLIINSCGTDGQVLRVMECGTEFTGVDMDEKSRSIEVTFTGFSDAATIQLFKKGAISVVS